MKRVIGVLIAVVMLLAAVPAAVFAEGVIPIATQADLEAIAEDLSGSYVLVGDIVLNGSFSPIGSEDAPFTGRLNGAGHTVFNLSVAVESKNTAAGGLIAYNKGTVSDLTLFDAAVSADGTDLYATTYIYAGGIAAVNDGTVEGCAVVGTVSGASTELTAYVGGIVGENRGVVRGCASYAAVEAVGVSEAVAGGIAGWNKGSIENSFNVKSVTATAAAEDTLCRAGGIAGKNGFAGEGVISRCHNVGAVSAPEGESDVGGISGNNLKTVENCYYLNTAAEVQIGTSAETTGGLSEAEYLVADHFVGFDFESVWSMEPYPTLIGVTLPAGDTNADGAIDTADVLYILRYCNLQSGVEISLKAGDLNEDGAITLADAIRLMKRLAI